MIENLYDKVICDLRKYVNSINRNDPKQNVNVSDFLQNIINRVHFVSKLELNKTVLEKRLLREMKKFSKTIFISTSNADIYNDKLQRNIDRLAWINTKHKINTSPRKYTVAQKEIFYANLGDNIGSEQNGRRPVIILQNNTGNRKGNTTIVAPVTTHQKSALKYDKKKKMYYIEKTIDGNTKRKYLGSYEVPLRLEYKKSDSMYGFINVMHLREIDRKRIDSRRVGIATDDCFKNVINAINKNLQS